MVDCTFDPSAQEAEADRPIRIWRQPGLCNDFQASHAYCLSHVWCLEKKPGNQIKNQNKNSTKTIGWMKVLTMIQELTIKSVASALNSNHKRSSLRLFPQLWVY